MRLDSRSSPSPKSNKVANVTLDNSNHNCWSVIATSTVSETVDVAITLQLRSLSDSLSGFNASHSMCSVQNHLITHSSFGLKPGSLCKFYASHALCSVQNHLQTHSSCCMQSDMWLLCQPCNIFSTKPSNNTLQLWSVGQSLCDMFASHIMCYSTEPFSKTLYCGIQSDSLHSFYGCHAMCLVQSHVITHSRGGIQLDSLFGIYASARQPYNVFSTCPTNTVILSN